MRHLILNNIDDAIDYFSQRDNHLQIKFLNPSKLYVDINLLNEDNYKVTPFLCVQAIRIYFGFDLINLPRKHKKRFTIDKLTRLYNLVVSEYGFYLSRLRTLIAENEKLIEGFVYGASNVRCNVTAHYTSEFLKALKQSKVHLFYNIIDLSFYPPSLRITLIEKRTGKPVKVVYNEAVMTTSVIFSSTKKKTLKRQGNRRSVEELERVLI